MTTSATAPLGHLDVKRIGFGAMQLAGPGVFGPPRDRNEALAVLRRAVELGVDHIDTSQFYGPDVVNELIREALHPYPEGLRLVTKVGARRDDRGGWLPAQQPQELRAGVEANLRALDVEQIDLVNLRLMPGPAEADLAEQLGELEQLRDEGKLGLIGVSNVSLEQLDESLQYADIAGVQNAFSIVSREAQDVLARCQERELAFVPFFPLGSAFTGGPAQLAADPVISRVAAKHGASVTQVALAWLLARDPRILLIPGTSSVVHLEENLGAGALALDEADLAELELVTQLGTPGH
jgi:aryl-alcohol dehydrogenase-like predicted oxidoreductase